MAERKNVPGASVDPKYKDFTITDTVYKAIRGQRVPVSVLTPNDIKPIKPGKTPVIIRWHGGGLVTGQRLYADWFAPWILSLASKHGALIVCPDYTLLPESNGLSILADLQDFYVWLSANLSSHLPAALNLVPDLDNLLITGESAGGWLTMQSGFVLPSTRIAALLSFYPMLDMRAPFFTQKYEKQIMRMPQLDPGLLDAYTAKLSGSEVVTSRDPGSQTDPPFVVIMFQQGTYLEYFGKETELFPLERLDDAELKRLPPLWLAHGEADSAVPIEGSYKYAEKLREKFPEVPLHTTFVAGEEHGFDLHDAKNQAPATLETGWAKEGVQFVERFWPGQG